MKKNSIFLLLLLIASHTHAMKLVRKHHEDMFQEQNPLDASSWSEFPVEIRCKIIESLFTEIEQNDLNVLSELHKGQIHIAYKKAAEYAQLYPLIDIREASITDIRNNDKTHVLPISAYIRLTKDQCRTLFHIAQQQRIALLANPIGAAMNVALTQKLSIIVNGDVYNALQQLLQTHENLLSKIRLPFLLVQKDPSWKDLIETARSSDCKKIVSDRWNRLHSAMLSAIGGLWFMRAAQTCSNLFFVAKTLTLKGALCGVLGTPATAVLCCVLIHAHSSLDHYYKSNNQITFNPTTENTNNNTDQAGE